VLLAHQEQLVHLERQDNKASKVIQDHKEILVHQETLAQTAILVPLDFLAHKESQALKV